MITIGKCLIEPVKSARVLIYNEGRALEDWKASIQFQPSEFSAIMGAEICAVRAELPVLPLPLLLRSLVPPGLTRPPDMNAPAPPMKDGLPDCIISDGLVKD